MSPELEPQRWISCWLKSCMVSVCSYCCYYFSVVTTSQIYWDVELLIVFPHPLLYVKLKGRLTWKLNACDSRYCNFVFRTDVEFPGMIWSCCQIWREPIGCLVNNSMFIRMFWRPSRFHYIVPSCITSWSVWGNPVGVNQMCMMITQLANQ